MIRLYFDWNVLVQLKSGLLPELESILSNNKHRFHIFYSTAHIGDIYKGYDPAKGITDEIRSDLDFIKEITGNLCFIPSPKGVIPDEWEPLELFEDRIESENLASGMIGAFQGKADKSDFPVSGLLSVFSQMPLNILDGNDTTGKAEFNTFFPDFESDQTFGGLVASTVSLFQSLYNTEKYKELRTTFQKGMGINRDKMYNDPSPFQRLDKHIADSAFEENTFEEFHAKITEATNQSPKDWFDEVYNKYVTIDMAGYKEDKIKVDDRKKDTFKNTIEDSFHTAFASQCDIYVTNDNRNNAKTKAVYSELNINTKVFTSSEVVNFLTEYIQQEEASNLLENVFSKLKATDGFGSEENPGFTTYFLKDFVLDYFNKAFWVIETDKPEVDDNWMLILTKEKPTNGRFTFLKDIDLLIAKLIHRFGIPHQNKLTLSKAEVSNIQQGVDWDGRRWYIGRLLIKFISLNGYFQLYIYPISRESQASKNSQPE